MTSIQGLNEGDAAQEFDYYSVGLVFCQTLRNLNIVSEITEGDD